MAILFQGSCQLEYKLLAKLTGKREYFEIVSPSWPGDHSSYQYQGRLRYEPHGAFADEEWPLEHVLEHYHRRTIQQ